MTPVRKWQVYRGARAMLACLMLILTMPAAEAQAPQAKPPPKAAAPTAGPPSPIGVWIDHTGRGAVEIVACERALCGRIVWLKDLKDKRGRPLRDELNSDTSKRTRPICGLPVLGGLTRMADGSWDKGWIYDPEQGESFDVELRLLSSDVLQVKGYKVFKFLSETFQWKRTAQLPGPQCTTTQAAR